MPSTGLEPTIPAGERTQTYALQTARQLERGSTVNNNNSNNNLFTAVGLSPGGSGYFTCIQNMKLVTTVGVVI
jgi:hypothetical protein